MSRPALRASETRPAISYAAGSEQLCAVGRVSAVTRTGNDCRMTGTSNTSKKVTSGLRAGLAAPFPSRDETRGSRPGAARTSAPRGADPMETARTGGATARRELRMDQLLSAVENELIPRLLVSHSSDVDAPHTAAPEPASGPWADDDEVHRFAMLCIDDETDLLNRRVSDLLSGGIGLDAIYLHLIAAAARWLGEAWSDDELSFIDVQLGLCRLHRLVCECGPIGFQREGAGRPWSILLSTVPGDQHTFGVTLAVDFFRRYGWQVSNLAGLERDFLLERVAATSYSAVGFSLHNEDFAGELGGLIRTVRRRSCNPDLLVLVGGDYFVRNPHLAAEHGADLTACDAHRAVAAAEARLRAVAAGVRT